jgi:putative transposase
MIETIPSISPAMICRVLKQESTFRMWKLFPEYLSKFYWKKHVLWTDGYFVSTIGNVSEKTLQTYIEDQG